MTLSNGAIPSQIPNLVTNDLVKNIPGAQGLGGKFQLKYNSLRAKKQ